MGRKDSITVEDTIISVGDSLRATEKASYDGHAEMGELVTVNTIKSRDGSSMSFFVGVVAERPNSNWSNLDGRVAPGHGYYFRRRDLFRYFVPITMERMIIKDSFKFRKLELEGLECDILAFLPDGKSVFIQFDKNVGGCGCDGLGKAGHCLAVPRNILKKVEKSKNKRKKA